jgi:large subunit ribosomal protein L10
MPTAEKQAKIEAFTEMLQGATSVIVSQNKGLNADEVTQLRRAVRAQGLTMTVVKNTLAIRAAKAAGVEGLEQYLAGPTAITVSKGDIVAPAKVLSAFAKEHEKLQIMGGMIDGKPATAADVATFASLPSKEEVIAMLLRTINGPVSGLARVVNAWVEKRTAAEGTTPAA